MEKKLTIRMDEAAIDAAKNYAAERGTSVSSLTANFYRTLSKSKPSTEALPPITSSLVGILPPTVDEEEYRDYLEEKYS